MDFKMLNSVHLLCLRKYLRLGHVSSEHAPVTIIQETVFPY